MLLGSGTIDEIFACSAENNLRELLAFEGSVVYRLSHLSCNTDLREILIIHRAFRFI